jgi:hypothetical protein
MVIRYFHRELSAFYEAFTANHPSPYSALPIQYSDYAVWQREWFEEDLSNATRILEKQFASMPALELPTDRRGEGTAYRAFRGNQPGDLAG